MTPKQQLKSIEKKMQRIQNNNPDVDMVVVASRYFHDIKKYYDLRQQHFFLKFEMEHCQTCGKKL